ncbi:hypothetical protein COLO4_37702 [Corchorus olitorius]|uniref:Uncharacterized protein n=1 Tax=Corchorus olitorius TaxID=93759 RepID=A0A1R3FZY1_9ROSI|nr:hypothetical protein COLO4_37702 [Corchorus olitorius]
MADQPPRQRSFLRKFTPLTQLNASSLPPELRSNSRSS